MQKCILADRLYVPEEYVNQQILDNFVYSLPAIQQLLGAEIPAVWPDETLFRPVKPRPPGAGDTRRPPAKRPPRRRR